MLLFSGVMPHNYTRAAVGRFPYLTGRGADVQQGPDAATAAPGPSCKPIRPRRDTGNIFLCVKCTKGMQFQATEELFSLYPMKAQNFFAELHF